MKHHDRAKEIIDELNDPKTPAWRQRELRVELNAVFLSGDPQAVGEQAEKDAK